MTDNEKRIAIAEFCGWSNEEAKRGFKCRRFEGYGYSYNQITEQLPDYLNDLNAMRDALRELGDSAAIRYRCILTQAALNRNFDPMMASAREQAEAFLKAIGKL